MKRKVIKQGPATLMVSLPSSWVKKYGISKGDEIEMAEKGKTLLISREKERVVGEFTVNIDSPDDFLRRFIHVPYMLGYDSIRINYKDKAVVKDVQSQLGVLMGFEMVKETEDFCIIKNVARGIEEEFDVIFSRLIKIIVEFQKEILDSLKNSNNDMEDVLKRDKQFTRFELFSKRMLNKIGYKEDIKTRGLYAYTVLLEIVSDQLMEIGRYSLESNKQISKNTLNLFEMITEHTLLFQDIYSKYEAKKLIELKKMRNSIFQKIEKQIVKESDENPLLIHFYEITNQIHHATEQII